MFQVTNGQRLSPTSGSSATIVGLARPSRRVALRGNVDALNREASVWLADFEDAAVAVWRNILGKQADLLDVMRPETTFMTVEDKPCPLGSASRAGVVRSRAGTWRAALTSWCMTRPLQRSRWASPCAWPTQSLSSSDGASALLLPTQVVALVARPSVGRKKCFNCTSA